MRKGRERRGNWEGVRGVGFQGSLSRRRSNRERGGKTSEDGKRAKKDKKREVILRKESFRIVCTNPKKRKRTMKENLAGK